MSTITITGRATADPELTFGQDGTPRATLTVAENHRRFDKERNEWVDARTDFHRVTVWRALAEAVAEQVRKGMSVVIVGELESRTIERDGQKQTYWGVTARTVALEVRPERKDTGFARTSGVVKDDPFANQGSQEPPW